MDEFDFYSLPGVVDLPQCVTIILFHIHLFFGIKAIKFKG